MSWIRPVLNRYLRLTEKPHLRKATSPEALRRSFRIKARLFFHPPVGTRFETRPLGPGEALYVTPRMVRSDSVLLYFHGGGYVFGAPETHSAMLATLARRVGAPAVLPRYPLAPEHPYPAAPDFAEAVYDAVLAKHPGARILIGGDSAGGGLALTLLARLLRKGTALPAGVFAFSPLTDLSFSGDSIRTNADADVELPAERIPEMTRLYLNGVDPAQSDVSPLHADFTGAPPVWITAGTTEILLDDSRRIVDRMTTQGVAVTYVEEHDLPHVWPIFHNLLPEARATLANLAVWIRAQASSKEPTR
ncbi:alpha/beta hydrolase [uncultured Tateyamaria sp.]|uniref:alpha/beta hydrolase n=1 Tax=Tateyamaria sp. 1078 TaxID=3417464 RepID=UPI0026163FEB|nr:alpha/beta hydrolase [uncultured Tateyamaria sp.]